MGDLLGQANLHPLQGLSAPITYPNVWQTYTKVRDQAYYVKPL